MHIRRVSKLNNAAFLAIARRRNELKRLEVAARENKVTLMRKYRTGELPDVQRVTIAAFLAPLGVFSLPLPTSTSIHSLRIATWPSFAPYCRGIQVCHVLHEYMIAEF